ncbi:MAG: hypothetical protein JHD26_17325 [Gemmataceae bacterium]|jgi:DUF1016 N-terminal domain|nr:hypothetical protein [Gemmataceae bacterium]
MSFKSNAIHGISVSNPISEKPSRKLPFTLSWSHYILLLTIKETAERKFYEIESTNESWSVPELRHQKVAGDSSGKPNTLTLELQILNGSDNW